MTSAENFNSIKVRLELSKRKPNKAFASRFQFHKGAIRTPFRPRQKYSEEISIP